MNIIYCNRGTCPTFDHSLKSLKTFAPQCKIHVITDTPIPDDDIEVADIDAYSVGKEQLVANYKHMSTNPDWFELDCLVRWPVISEYVAANGLTEILVTDWDILFFCDPGIQALEWWNNDFTVSNKVSPGLSYWFNPRALHDYARLIVDTYSGRQSQCWATVHSHYDELQRHGLPGGVCDMTFMEYFRKHSPYQSDDTYQVKDGEIWDNNIHIVDEWESSAGMKKFRWANGYPVCWNTRLKKDVLFNCIHCTGDGKRVSGDILREALSCA